MDRLEVELRMLDYLQDRLAETIASSNAIPQFPQSRVIGNYNSQLLLIDRVTH
jgi:hypothetical protein